MRHMARLLVACRQPGPRCPPRGPRPAARRRHHPDDLQFPAAEQGQRRPHPPHQSTGGIPVGVPGRSPRTGPDPRQCRSQPGPRQRVPSSPGRTRSPVPRGPPRRARRSAGSATPPHVPGPARPLTCSTTATAIDSSCTAVTPCDRRPPGAAPGWVERAAGYSEKTMTGHEVERRALLTPVLLLLLAERQGHGYELVQRLGAFGCAEADPAHVYRLLRGMESSGEVTSHWHASAERSRPPGLRDHPAGRHEPRAVVRPPR